MLRLSLSERPTANTVVHETSERIGPEKLDHAIKLLIVSPTTNPIVSSFNEKSSWLLSLMHALLSYGYARGGHGLRSFVQSKMQLMVAEACVGLPLFDWRSVVARELIVLL